MVCYYGRKRYPKHGKNVKIKNKENFHCWPFLSLAGNLLLPLENSPQKRKLWTVACPAVLLVAEYVLVRLRLCLDTDQQMLTFLEGSPLADSSRGTCWCHSWRSCPWTCWWSAAGSLPWLPTHFQRIPVTSNAQERVFKMLTLTIRIVFAIVLSIGKISVWCLFRSVNGPGKKQNDATQRESSKKRGLAKLAGDSPSMGQPAAIAE